MKHDPKLKGTSKRDRSRSPTKSPADKRLKTDVHLNSTIEERLNKQDEQNHFLAKSLAGLSAKMSKLSSQQVVFPPVVTIQQPPGIPAEIRNISSHQQVPYPVQEQSWTHNLHNQIPRQVPVNYGLPLPHGASPFPANPYQ